MKIFLFIYLFREKLDAKSLCLATVEVAYEDDEITLNDADGIKLSRIKK